MRMVFLAFVLLVVGTGLALTSMGCGGGGAGGAPAGGPPVFAGQYVVFALSGNEGLPLSLRAAWGLATSDGLGGMTGSTQTNDTGVVSLPAPIPDFNYTVGGDRSVTWEEVAVPGVDALSGGLSSDGGLLTLASVAAGSDPMMAILARQAGTYTVASLNGTYHVAGWTLNLPGATNASQFGTVTFDGAGNGTYLAPANEEGSLVAASSIPFTYDVSSGGGLGVFFSTWNWVGLVRSGGELVLAGGAIDSGDFPALQVMIKHSTGASAATVNGSYFIAGLQHDPGTPAYVSLTGRAVANGAGGVDVTFTENEEGTITTSPSDSATYTVAANGAMTVTTGGGEAYLGAVTPTGDAMMLGGPNTVGADPGFFFLIR